MKLKNKRTGEIREVADVIIENLKKNGSTLNAINIDEIREEWEDVLEEPKEYWAIDCFSTDGNIVSQFTGSSSDILENRKSIGNYFGTEEEAEKASEKLKAWKRLRDNGFKFEGIEKRGHHIHFYQGKSYETDKQCQQAMKDLDLLFGGEE